MFPRITGLYHTYNAGRTIIAHGLNSLIPMFREKSWRLTRSQTDQPRKYLLRKFRGLKIVDYSNSCLSSDNDSDSDSEAEHNNEECIETAGSKSARRKPGALASLPLEIILHIANYLPDVGSAIRLSYVCRALYMSLAGSRYFWFRWGSKKLKSFQKYSPGFDYRKYILNAVSGGFKTTCQMCLSPRVGKVRTDIQNKVLCMACVEKGIVLKSAVLSIRRVDWSSLSTITHTCDNTGPLELQGHPGTNHFYWFPLVKQRLEEFYAIPWESIVKTHLHNIRALASPVATRDYRETLQNEIREALKNRTKDFYQKYFQNVFTEETFSELIQQLTKTSRSIETKISNVWAPIEGQTVDPTLDPTRIANAILESYCGILIEHGRKSLNPARLDPVLRIAVEKCHIYRMVTSGNVFGQCSICMEPKSYERNPVRFYAHRGNRGFIPSDLVYHVLRDHSGRFLKMDWRLKGGP